MTIASCFSTGSVPSITPTTFEPIPSGWCSVTFFIVITLPVANDAGFSVLRIAGDHLVVRLARAGEHVVPDRRARPRPTRSPSRTRSSG